jgi:hypothetical protein
MELTLGFRLDERTCSDAGGAAASMRMDFAEADLTKH